MAQSQYSLTWDLYKSSICSGFSSLQQNGEFVDMTLAADGHYVKVHQVLVALSSSYLKTIITSTPCQHPVIFLNNVSKETLCQLLEYIYSGEVVVPEANFRDFSNTAKLLAIRGLESIASNENIVHKVAKDAFVETVGQVQLPINARNVIVKKEELSAKYQRTPQNTMDQCSQRQESHLEDDSVHEYIDSMDDTDVQESDYKEVDTPSKECGTDDIVNIQSNKETSKLQFSVSIRGALQIILNRYIYNLSWKRSKGMRRWRCVDYRSRIKCPAILITKDTVVLNRCHPHNHPYHDNKILNKVNKNMVFSTYEDVKMKVGIEENKGDSSEGKEKDETM